jgi:hypothetical protein
MLVVFNPQVRNDNMMFDCFNDVLNYFEDYNDCKTIEDFDAETGYQTYQVDKIDDVLAQENGLSLMPNLKNIQIKGIKVLNKNTDEFEFQKVELDIFSKK